MSNETRVCMRTVPGWPRLLRSERAGSPLSVRRQHNKGKPAPRRYSRNRAIVSLVTVLPCRKIALMVLPGKLLIGSWLSAQHTAIAGDLALYPAPRTSARKALRNDVCDIAGLAADRLWQKHDPRADIGRGQTLQQAGSAAFGDTCLPIYHQILLQAQRGPRLRLASLLRAAF